MNDEGQQQPANSPEARTRITAETVRQAQQERENKWSLLMDGMEASVREKGQYFVKFGDKNKGVDQTTDTRVLLLIKSAVDKKDGNNLFVVITRDGAKGLRLIPQDKSPQDQDQEAEGKMKSIIQHKLETPQQDYQTEGGNGLRDDGRLIISSPETTFHFPSDTARITAVDFETVKTAIAESQNVAEIPHFVKLQEEQQRITDANNLLDVIKQLPPKQ